MRTLDDMARAREKYQAGISTLLGMGGLQDHIPTTEQEWLLFNVNQRLRDEGVGKPLPWPDESQGWTADDVIDALERAKAAIG